ncbi:MAG TPA: thiaminase II [Paludibaculum sp.]|jgi:thiaminase/transcriptional activator TenA
MRLLVAFCLLLPLTAQEFTRQLWEPIQPIYARTLQHPFLTGLTDGTLPRENFEFYLIQDTLYLRTFAQALNILASRSPRKDWALTLSRHAADALQEERELHVKILSSYGITPARIAASEKAPTTLAYTNHLLASVQLNSFTEGLAAMLPCYWIYLEVGKDLVRRGSKNKDYQRWIDQYSGDAYAATVRQMLAIVDESARTASPRARRSAQHLFTLSARYEYLFWEMAWQREAWKP